MTMGNLLREFAVLADMNPDWKACGVIVKPNHTVCQAYTTAGNEPEKDVAIALFNYPVTVEPFEDKDWFKEPTD
jgi:hypothetical protein